MIYVAPFIESLARDRPFYETTTESPGNDLHNYYLNTKQPRQNNLFGLSIYSHIDHTCKPFLPTNISLKSCCKICIMLI